MRFHFKIQPYQTEAVDAVVQVFSGQGNHGPVRYRMDPGRKDDAALRDDGQLRLYGQPEDEVPAGYRNMEITLTDEQLLHNIRARQAQGNIRQSAALSADLGRCGLDVEMETGTGKTYVYIKTMFELNKLYGWSKFIVVVPSVAIREGVRKTFEITEDHFMKHYGKKARYFVYNSKDLDQLDAFSSSSDISVMIINTQAFAASLNEEKNVEGRRGDQAARIIYSTRDEFASRRPIDVIAANRPIIIMDEPQKMGGAVTQTALKKFRPLFSLNYSATHARQHDLVYVLDAVDAFNKRLVKKIEVKGLEVRNLRGTDHYLYLESIVLSGDKPPRARMEFEAARGGGPRRETRLLEDGDDLYRLSNGMEQYRGYTVHVDPEGQRVTFLNGEEISVGEVQGDVSERSIRRIQIRETIESHFEKEEALFNMGIKTLSLFFIDEVSHYRVYDEAGQEQPGEFGVMFEQEYRDILERHLTDEDTPYQKYLREVCADPCRVHRGYFSIDKNGRSVNSARKRGSEFSDDISAYDLILKNKERLLSFEEPTRFIFSHSALREGWDNPNVFQICTLKHSDSQTGKRQEVGRGLRLCVNRSGIRMDEEFCGEAVHEINRLTVVASESYADFVAELQRDIRKDLCERPTRADRAYFTGKTVRADGRSVVLTDAQANRIHRYLIQNFYVDDNDQITAEYREAVRNKALAPLPEDLRAMEEGIHRLVQAVFDERVLKQMAENGNAPNIPKNALIEEKWAEFQPLWELLRQKYAYTVSGLDRERLVRAAAGRINEKLFVTELKYVAATGQQQEQISESALARGESFGKARSRTQTLHHTEASQISYDLVGKVAGGTTLTRRTAAAILAALRPDKFDMFRKNPEEFISKVVRLILEAKSELIVDGISYHPIQDQYDRSVFTARKFPQNLDRAYRAEKHIQAYVFTDGLAEESVERRFAEELDAAEEVLVYAKLPRAYQIPTPMGSYSPDWAILFKTDTVPHVFFLTETKGTTEEEQLRPIEQAKIRCAQKLFNQMPGSQVRYAHASSYQDLLDQIPAICRGIAP